MGHRNANDRNRQSPPSKTTTNFGSRHSSIDPDLIKFYQAFKNSQNITKLPIKPQGVDFREDLDKLKQVTIDMRETMKRVRIEKANLSNREDQMNEILQEFRNYQRNHGLIEHSQNAGAANESYKGGIQGSFFGEHSGGLHPVATLLGNVSNKAKDLEHQGISKSKSLSRPSKTVLTKNRSYGTNGTTGGGNKATRSLSKGSRLSNQSRRNSRESMHAGSGLMM